MGTNLTTYSEEAQVKPDFTTTIKPNQVFFKFKVKVSDFESIINISRLKDLLYQEAINNLLKKSKFLQLYIQLIENQISEEEYEDELNSHPDDYFINLKDLNSNLDYAALLLVLQNLPKQLSVDEVSEIFGIKTQAIMNQLNAKV